MGIRLRQEGIEDFEIFERGETVGGVWRANTYPGAACDVPSHLYSFSFAPGHNWSRRYAPQAEIQEYMEEITDRFGMRSHLRLGTEVTSATFDEASGRWTVTLDNGESREFDLLVTACGQLTRPQVPHVEGIDDFSGSVFHSAEWDHSHDLKGRNVAVIGTGASAIQFVPEVAKEAGTLTIYQRSAPWILPKTDREYPEWERRIFERFPARVAAARAGFFTFFEAGTYGFTGNARGPGPVSSRGQCLPLERARGRPGALRARHPRLRDRLQARPLHQRLVLDPARAKCRAPERRRPAGHGDWSRWRRRRGARGGHDHLGHRLRRLALRLAHGRPRRWTAAHSTRPGATRPRRSWAQPSRAFRTCS